MSPVERARIVVGNAGLTRSTTERVVELDSVETAELLRWCADDGVVGLAVAACGSGTLILTETSGDPLLDRFHDALRRCLVADAVAVSAVTALTAAGVDHRVLKGVATARLDFPTPELRVFADADILVERQRLGEALHVLDAAGLRRVDAPVRGWWEQRFGRAVELRGAHDGELDLHLSLGSGFFATRCDEQTMWSAPPDTFTIGGVEMRALGGPYRLLHACLHAELGRNSGWRGVRDVAQMILGADVDLRTTVQIATESDADGVVAAAIRRTWTLLELSTEHPAAEWARAHVCPARQLAEIEAHRSGGWRAQARGTWRALPWRDRGPFVAGIIAPSTANLRGRNLRRRDHLAGLVPRIGRRR